MSSKLKIVNIFHTLDGEVSQGGPLHWSTFIRFGGCNLRCWKSSGFCDAPASLDMSFPYPEYSVSDILFKLQEFLPCKRVTITGGEPLMQPDGLYALAETLHSSGYVTTLETSGSKHIFPRQMTHFSSIIADLKPPSTEMASKNCEALFTELRPRDFIKVVLQDRSDYEWALSYLRRIPTHAQIAFGPRWGHLPPAIIAEWLREDKRFDIMLNLQLHKYIWAESISGPVYDLKAIDREALNAAER